MQGNKENISYKFRLTKFGKLGKSVLIESELGDFGVRKYDYEIGRFTSIDPLWEKYYSWTPYHYCSNNPVMNYDYDGLKVKAANKAAQTLVINSVEPELRQYVVFDKLGYASITLDIDPIKDLRDKEGNINIPSNLEALQTLIKSNETFNVKMMKTGDKIPMKDKNGVRKNANILPEFYGLAFFRESKNGEITTIDGKNIAYINENSRIPGNKSVAHELYLHCLFWLFNIPNSHSGENSKEIDSTVKEVENNAK